MTVSEEISWRAEQGEQSKYTVESFNGYPSAPMGAKDVVSKHEDGKFTLSYTLQTGDSAAVYSIKGSTSQEPLATHAMFRSGDWAITAEEWRKWKLWETDPKDADLADWKPEKGSVGMQAYYDYRNRGVDDYLLGTVTMTISVEDSGMPNLRGLGRRATPEGAPSLDEGRTWLLTGIDADSVGRTTWKVTREYRASGAGGWDPNIYDKA